MSEVRRAYNFVVIVNVGVGLENNANRNNVSEHDSSKAIKMHWLKLTLFHNSNKMC